MGNAKTVQGWYKLLYATKQNSHNFLYTSINEKMYIIDTDNLNFATFIRRYAG